MRPLRLNHVAVPVCEMARAVAFYQILGLRPGFEKHDPISGAHLVQMGIDGDGQFIELIKGTNAPRPTPNHAAHFCFRVTDIQATHAWLHDQGMSPHSTPNLGNSGVDWFFVTDPDGNLIEFTAPAKAAP